VLVIEKLKDWLSAQGRAVVLALVGTAATRLWLAVSDHSVFWPDEIYQSIEPAHRLAFGYGLLPWEFRDGARSWIFPALLALPLKLVALLHLNVPLAPVVSARLVMVLAAVAAAALGIEYARRLAGKSAALLVAFAFACFPPLLVYSHRTLQEAASAPLVMLVPLCLLSRTRRAAVWAGVAIGVATLLRFQCAIVAATFLVALVFERRWAQLATYAAGGGVVALAGGALDWVTWGRPFHSFLTYVEFNLVKGGASTFGVSPPTYYLGAFWNSSGPAVLLLGLGFIAGGVWAARTAAAATVLFIALHSAIPHKEFRFLLPIFPLLLSVGGAGLALLLARFKAPARAAGALAAVLCVGFVNAARAESYADLGQYVGTARASGSPWYTEEGTNLLLAEAGGRADACGVLVLGERAAFTGGYSYLHRRIPLIYRFQTCDEAKAANYVIAANGNPNVPPGFKSVQTSGGYALYHREGSCGPPPEDSSDMLEGADDMGLGRGALLQPNPHELAIHAGANAAAFVSGWGNGEHLECRYARWAVAPWASVAFPLEPNDALYSLEFTARPHPRASPQSVRVRLNGELLDEFPLELGWHRYQTPIQRGLLHKGRNTLEFAFARLKRAGGDDPRSLAALFDQISVVGADPTISIDVGTDEADRYLTEGFGEAEHDDRRTFAWSDGPRSELAIPTIALDVPTVFQVVARAHESLAPLNVSVSLNEHSVGQFTFGDDYTRSALLLPGKLLEPATNVIALTYDRTAKLGDSAPDSSDRRPLAVAYDRFTFRPLPTTTAIDLGTEEGHVFEGPGFSRDETADGRTFVWSDGPRSTIWFRTPPAALDAVCRLEVVAAAFPGALPLEVGVSQGGTRIGAFKPSVEWEKYVLPLDSRFNPGANVIEFGYSRTARPSATPHGRADARELALRFDRLDAICATLGAPATH
jgi:phosphatidylinositol glycan class B